MFFCFLNSLGLSHTLFSPWGSILFFKFLNFCKLKRKNSSVQSYKGQYCFYIIFHFVSLFWKSIQGICYYIRLPLNFESIRMIFLRTVGRYVRRSSLRWTDEYFCLEGRLIWWMVQHGNVRAKKHTIRNTTVWYDPRYYGTCLCYIVEILFWKKLHEWHRISNSILCYNT